MFGEEGQLMVVPIDVWPENSPGFPCDGLQLTSGEWRAKQPYLILITRLPQRGPHLSVHLTSWDELASDRILPRSVSVVKLILRPISDVSLSHS